MINVMTGDQKTFLKALYSLFQEGQFVVSLEKVAGRLEWEHDRFMEISDSLLVIKRIIVTLAGISLIGIGQIEARQIANAPD